MLPVLRQSEWIGLRSLK